MMSHRLLLLLVVVVSLCCFNIVPVLGQQQEEEQSPGGEGGGADAVKKQQCGTNSGKYCLNGGTCHVSYKHNDGSMDYVCDCSTAYDNDHIYDGPICQYQSTSLCVDDNTIYETLQGVPYCVNNGICNIQNMKHGPCTCPNGYTGAHCEFEIIHKPNPTTGNGAGAASGTAAVDSMLNDDPQQQQGDATVTDDQPEKEPEPAKEPAKAAKKLSRGSA